MKRLLQYTKRVITIVKSATEFIWGWTTLIFCAAAVAFMFFGFLKILVAPLAPLITLLFAIWGTSYACTSKPTAVLSFLGLAIYAASWPSAAAWGVNIGVAICGIGFLTWMMAIYFAFDLRNPQPHAVTT